MVTADRDTARAALAAINPAALEYDEWLAVGMALHAAGCAVEDWEQWHPDGNKNHGRQCREKWRGFGRHGAPVSTGSLVTWCKEDGGQPPRGARADVPDVPLTWESTGPRT